MSDHEGVNNFWDEVISIAADDPEIRRVMSAPLLSEGQEIGYDTISEYIGDRYGLIDLTQVTVVLNLAQRRNWEENNGR